MTLLFKIANSKPQQNFIDIVMNQKHACILANNTKQKPENRQQCKPEFHNAKPAFVLHILTLKKTPKIGACENLLFT